MSPGHGPSLGYGTTDGSLQWVRKIGAILPEDGWGQRLVDRHPKVPIHRSVAQHAPKVAAGQQFHVVEEPRLRDVAPVLAASRDQFHELIERGCEAGLVRQTPAILVDGVPHFPRASRLALMSCARSFSLWSKKPVVQVDRSPPSLTSIRVKRGCPSPTSKW